MINKVLKLRIIKIILYIFFKVNINNFFIKICKIFLNIILEIFYNKNKL